MFNKVGAEGLFNQKCPEEMEKGEITSEKDSLLSVWADIHSPFVTMVFHYCLDQTGTKNVIFESLFLDW